MLYQSLMPIQCHELMTCWRQMEQRGISKPLIYVRGTARCTRRVKQTISCFPTPPGLLQFIVMPFGMYGAPATFQRLMDIVLKENHHYSAVCLGDAMVFSNQQNHLQHLSLMLGKINETALTQETRYLGYQPVGGEVSPQADKVKVIRNCPQPHIKKEVQSFFGLAD